MDHTVRIYAASDNALQRGFGAIRNNFGVDFATTLSILMKNCTDFTEIKVYHPASPISWKWMAGYPPFAAVVL